MSDFNFRDIQKISMDANLTVDDASRLIMRSSALVDIGDKCGSFAFGVAALFALLSPYRLSDLTEEEVINALETVRKNKLVQNNPLADEDIKDMTSNLSATASVLIGGNFSIDSADSLVEALRISYAVVTVRDIGNISNAISIASGMSRAEKSDSTPPQEIMYPGMEDVCDDLHSIGSNLAPLVRNISPGEQSEILCALMEKLMESTDDDDGPEALCSKTARWMAVAKLLMYVGLLDPREYRRLYEATMDSISQSGIFGKDMPVEYVGDCITMISRSAKKFMETVG